VKSYRELFPGELERVDYLSLFSRISLKAMCEVLTLRFDLQEFEFGGEDEYEYAFALTDGIQYDIARACGEGALRINGVPTVDGSNFSVAVLFHEGRPAVPSAPELMSNLSRILADELSVDVRRPDPWLWQGDEGGRGA